MLLIPTPESPKSSPSFISNALQRVVSSLPSELPTNKPGSILGQCPPATVPDQAGRENSGSALRPPITNLDVPAGRDQPRLPQDKAGTSLPWLGQE